MLLQILNEIMAKRQLLAIRREVGIISRMGRRKHSAFGCFDPCGSDNGSLIMVFLGMKKISGLLLK